MDGGDWKCIQCGARVLEPVDGKKVRLVEPHRLDVHIKRRRRE